LIVLIKTSDLLCNLFKIILIKEKAKPGDDLLKCHFDRVKDLHGEVGDLASMLVFFRPRLETSTALTTR